MKIVKADKGITTLEHDGLEFKIFDDAIGFKEEFIGIYFDRNGTKQKVMRDSVYGVQVIDAVNAYYIKQWSCKI